MNEWSPFLQEIGNSLFSCIPENWETATLLVEHQQIGKEPAYYIPHIKSPIGRSEQVIPSLILLVAIQKLGNFFQDKGVHWGSYILSLYQDEAFTWKLQFIIQYEE